MVRFSIRHLLGATAAVAVAIVVLHSASAFIASAVVGAALVSLAASLLLAIFRDGSSRAFWVGYAIWGWLYIALLAFSISHGRETGINGPLSEQNLITSRISRQAHQKLFPRTVPATLRLPGRTVPGGPVGTPIGSGPGLYDFINVAHGLWTFLLATTGGWLAQWLAGSNGQPFHKRSDGARLPRAS
jgi:hypothetical protein